VFLSPVQGQEKKKKKKTKPAKKKKKGKYLAGGEGKRGSFTKKKTSLEDDQWGAELVSLSERERRKKGGRRECEWGRRGRRVPSPHVLSDPATPNDMSDAQTEGKEGRGERPFVHLR